VFCDCDNAVDSADKIGMPENRRTPQEAIVKTAEHRRNIVYRPQDTQMNNVALKLCYWIKL